MTRVSFSRVDCWKQCPRKYFHRYIQGIKPEFDYKPTNPLVLGSTLDLGIQKGYEEAEKYYWDQYPVATNEGETELMKIAYWLPELRERYNRGEFQVKIQSDRFLGFADYIEDGLMVDFKYSNNVDKYSESAQLHVYASELPEIPERMAYVCIPKTFIRQKQDEDMSVFRSRVKNTLDTMSIQFVEVEYNQSKVDGFWKDAEAMQNEESFETRPNENCKWCEYANLCKATIVPEGEPKKRKLKPRSEIPLKQ